MFLFLSPFPLIIVFNNLPFLIFGVFLTAPECQAAVNFYFTKVQSFVWWVVALGDS